MDRKHTSKYRVERPLPKGGHRSSLYFDDYDKAHEAARRASLSKQGNGTAEIYRQSDDVVVVQYVRGESTV